MLADFRPNLAAQRRHIDRFGPEAAEDFAVQPVTAAWRSQNVLVRADVFLDGPLIDLIDLAVRQEVEERHIDLLVEHGLDHLDLHEITTRRRAITQTIAADLYDNGAAAVRFPSRCDGEPCVAVFEGRGTLDVAHGPLPLTDPPPAALTTVAEDWRLVLEPTT